MLMALYVTWRSVMGDLFYRRTKRWFAYARMRVGWLAFNLEEENYAWIH